MIQNISKSQLEVFQDVEQIDFPGTTRHSRQYAASGIYRSPLDSRDQRIAVPPDEFADQKQAIAGFSGLVA